MWNDVPDKTGKPIAVILYTIKNTGTDEDLLKVQVL